MDNSLEKRIANYEEIRPKKQKSETSLVVFTILVQMAVGAFWAAHWATDSVPLAAYLVIGACLAVGGFFSFAHLGAKRNAWRAPFHLMKSWLSREILFVGLFGMGWLASIASLFWTGLEIAPTVTSLLGVGLVFIMAQVYRLHVMPAWDTWRTNAGFFITSLLLGHLAMMNLLDVTEAFAWEVLAVLLALELALILSAKPKAQWPVNRLRVGLSAATMLGAGMMLIAPNLSGGWVSPILFLLVMTGEVIGRVSFYKALDEKPL
jgi:DMSO reductase anchor subunit